jgi:hypothetical protein
MGPMEFARLGKDTAKGLNGEILFFPEFYALISQHIGRYAAS